VLDGDAVTVLVGGQAGVGKSRLVSELVAEARAAGAQALIGGCVELDGSARSKLSRPPIDRAVDRARLRDGQALGW
jgi:hypothetical protein